jgi:hypothetical protein
VGKKETIPTLAANYGVGPLYAANVIRYLDILNTGQAVQFNGEGPSYNIRTGDSLDTVVNALCQSQPETCDQKDFAQLATALTPADALFLEGAVVNVTKASYRIGTIGGESDTFKNIAGYFDTTVDTVVLANGEVPDVFKPGTSVTLDGVTKPVDAADTLLKMAGKFGMTSRDFANALWTCDVKKSSSSCYTLNTGTPTLLYFMRILPTLSFTTGKVPLAAGDSPATFLFSVKNPALQRMVLLDLDYVVNEMEYDLDDSDVDDYRESSWLSFIIPMKRSQEQVLKHANSRMGQVRVPVPLRAYPSFPVMSDQTAAPAHPGETDLKKAKEWIYGFDFEHQNAAQDTVDYTVYFNYYDKSGLNARLKTGSFESLYEKLAQFVQVYPDLANDLALLADPNRQEKAKPAVEVFAQLVGDVAAAWPGASLTLEKRTVPGDIEIRNYTMDTIVSESKPGEIAYLSLSAPVSQSPFLWPTINGKAAPDASPEVSEVLYPFDAGISDPLNLVFGFGDLDVIKRQNGWSNTAVTRNANLLNTVSTNDEFVYRTPLSSFSNKVTPMLSVTAMSPLPVGKEMACAPGGTENCNTSKLALALGRFFQELFNIDPASPPDGSIRIKMTARYRYNLLTTSPNIKMLVEETTLFTDIPLVHIPLYEFQLNRDWSTCDCANFVCRLEAAVWTAADDAGVKKDSGMFIFDTGVFSTLPGASNLPVLNVRNRYFDLSGEMG